MAEKPKTAIVEGQDDEVYHDLAEYETLEKIEKIISLLRQAFTWRQIAAEMGYATQAGPQHLFTRWFEKNRTMLAEDASKMRFIWHQRNDAILRGGLYMKAQKGEYAAIDRFLRIQEREASMFGLDAPKAALIGVGAVGTGEATGAEAARLVREMFGDHAAKAAEEVIDVEPDSPDEKSGSDTGAAEVPALPPRK